MLLFHCVRSESFLFVNRGLRATVPRSQSNVTLLNKSSSLANSLETPAFAASMETVVTKQNTTRYKRKMSQRRLYFYKFTQYFIRKQEDTDEP